MDSLNQGPRLLIADDDAEMLDVLRRALTREGYCVDCASNGRHALDRISSKGSYHVLVTDIRMPEKDGITLLREAIALEPSIKVILITAFGTPEQCNELKMLGAYEYLPKPFKIPELLALIERALGLGSGGAF